MAEDAVDHAIVLGHLDERPCATRELRIHGSDASGLEALIHERPDLAVTLHAALPINGAEVVWAAREEMARTVEDVLARRTRALFLNTAAALAMAPEVARLLARELGRDQAWEAAQLAAFREVAAHFAPPATPAR
jgi:glycerol-3-phosphate dehydrogenase